MDIPNAKTAREIVTFGKYEKAQKQRAEVWALINEAINNGKTSIVLEEVILEQPVKESLQGLGYTVKYDSWRNESYTSISW